MGSQQQSWWCHRLGQYTIGTQSQHCQRHRPPHQENHDLALAAGAPGLQNYCLRDPRPETDNGSAASMTAGTCLEDCLFACSVCVCDQIRNSLEVNITRLFQSFVHNLSNHTILAKLPFINQIRARRLSYGPLHLFSQLSVRSASSV